LDSGDEIQDESLPHANTGVTQLLELTSFRGTSKLSSQEVSAKVENIGGMVQCIASREHIIFCIDTLRVNAEDAIELIADSVLTPRVTNDDIEEAKTIVSLQSESLPADVSSLDLLSMAEYQNSPIGNNHFCPNERIEYLTVDMLKKFRDENIFAGNLVVAGAGIDHNLFVDMVSNKFAAVPTDNRKASRKKSLYTGGMRTVERELQEPYAKVAIGFEYAAGWKDPNLMTGIVLQSLLGGGSSFSAGGPGKGMYTRLYRNVLNRHVWMESAEGVLSVGDDSAMMTIDIACPEKSIAAGIQVIVNEFWKLANEPVLDEELNRAKNMARSSMLMQLESRLVTCEDIARQIATFGHRKDISETCQLIDSVRQEDVMMAAKKMLSTVPSVAIIGADLSGIPTFQMIHNFIKSQV
jgi:processing peptidase subunit alpha